MAEYGKKVNFKDYNTERVISGHVRNVPKQQSTVIRIFLSSTFTGNHLLFIVFKSFVYCC